MTKILQSQHKGSTAIESVILFPIIFATFMTLIYLLFMVLAYITYGNIANSIAHEMNMRRNGYNTARSLYSNGSKMPEIYTYKMNEVQGGNAYDTQPGGALTKSQVVCNPDNTYIRSGAYYAIDITSRNKKVDYKSDQFIFPFVQVNKVVINSSKPLNFSSTSTSSASIASNAIISVTIEFAGVNPFGTMNQFSNNGTNSLLKFKVIGYDVIN